MRDFDPAYDVSGPTTAESASLHQVCFCSIIRHCRCALALRVCAMCGRLRVGKNFLHVASLVGAAMCSACLCGSHDRWP
jgi:hypothetical protein